MSFGGGGGGSFVFGRGSLFFGGGERLGEEGFFLSQE